MLARRVLQRAFSYNSGSIPIIDAEALLGKKSNMLEECKKAADCMHKTGIMILRDPRVNDNENERFLDLMEKYYENRSKQYYSGMPLHEAKPESGYQTGILPELQERARNHSETIDKYFPASRPATPQPPPKDKKWRYMWRVGSVAEMSNNKILSDNAVPADFPGWANQMDSFGSILRESCYTASEILALGIGADRMTFRSRMEGGTQLLGPTGSDLSKYNTPGHILAGFHYGKLMINKISVS